MGALNPSMVCSCRLDDTLLAVYNPVQLVDMAFHQNVGHAHDHRCSWMVVALGNILWVVRVAVYMVCSLCTVMVGMHFDHVRSNRSPDGIGALHHGGLDLNTNPFQTMEHRSTRIYLDLDPSDPIDS